MSSSVVIVERAPHLLAREPQPVGDALAKALEADGIELRLGQAVTSARMDGSEYVLLLADGAELRGDHLLVAAGRRPRVDDIGLETVGIVPDPRGIPVDDRMSAGDRLWAIGDVTGQWQLTHVGEYQGRVVADNILGRTRAVNYDAVPRVVFSDPQAAVVGAPSGALTATVALSEVARAATYSREYAAAPGFLTLVSDGERLTGAYAVGPEAGEWLQQATVAIRAQIPLATLLDVIQPFPTFSEAFLQALRELDRQLTSRHGRDSWTRLREAVVSDPGRFAAGSAVVEPCGVLAVEAQRRQSSPVPTPGRVR
jgi:pyruvate/2-oxoglutarate dehydrogenase complex dihydrolipoamide dehydrogenase (E3) component